MPLGVYQVQHAEESRRRQRELEEREMAQLAEQMRKFAQTDDELSRGPLGKLLNKPTDDAGSGR